MIIKRLDLDNISDDEFLYLLDFMVFHYNLIFDKNIRLSK